MISFKLFISIYLIGGVTFLPMTVFAVIFMMKWMDERRERESESKQEKTGKSSSIDPDFKAGEFEEAKGVDVTRQDWIQVTTKYYYFHTEIPTSSSDENGADTDNEILERSQLKKKHRFFAVIKHGNLFLYRDNSPNSNLIHAISLQDSFVTLWPRNSQDELPDGALFTKRTCISILRKGSTFVKSGELEFAPNTAATDDAHTTNQFFLYFENNSEKEDWYFDLINVSKSDSKANKKSSGLIDPNITARTAHLRTANMLYLIQTINSTEGQLTTKWLNALLGRLFLTLQRTETLKNFLHKKLYQKLSKIKKPDFLDDFVVEEVDVGNSAPIFTNPKLLDLTIEGHTKFSFDFIYKGDLSVIVSTKATINLGSRFKQREVALKISLRLKELSGPLVFLLKPPPSNRIWYTFQTEPILDVEVEPVVSSSKLSYNMVTNAIKSKFAEALKESLVYPYWDDMAFYNTEHEIYRGGIWENNAAYAETEEKIPAQDNSPSKNSNQSSSQINKNSDVENVAKTTLHSEKATKTLDVRSSMDGTSVRRRSSQKIENFRRILKTRSNDGPEEQHSPTELTSQMSTNTDEFEELEDSATSKKYFKNSIKKIGKWYKEAVSTDGIENESSNDENIGTKPITSHTAPEMISNRRAPLPRKSRTSTLSTSNQTTTDTSLNPISPQLNSTEMFVNKSKSRSRSSSKDAGVYISNNYSKYTAQAFVKMPNDHDGIVEGVSNKIEKDTKSRKSSNNDISKAIDKSATPNIQIDLHSVKSKTNDLEIKEPENIERTK